MSTPILSTPSRTLLAGTVMAASAVVLALVGGTIGVPEPWPVLLVAGAGLLVGIPRLQHGLALAIGATFGLITTWLSDAVLPDATTGTALATGLAVLLITVVTIVSHGRLRFGMQLVGWAAMTMLAESLVGPDGPTVTGFGQLLRVHLTLLVAAGLGLLIAQVAQLLATGVTARRDAARFLPGVALVLGLAGIGAAPASALADDGMSPALQHQQVIVRSHASDGTPGRGVVLTRLDASGPGVHTVVLHDQATSGLRDLGGFGALRADGGQVTYELSAGVPARSIATLDRVLPVTIGIEYRLDGRSIPPAVLVGRSGRLEVTYTFTNRTAEPRELRFFDASGRARAVTREVAVPIAGTIGVTLDDRFTGVRTDRGRVIIGRGGRQDLVADIVLFEPVGTTVQTVTWTADVQDAAVPAVQVRLSPVGTNGASEAARSAASARALRDVADTGGLLRTGLRALGVTTGPTGAADTTALLIARMDLLLEGLLATTKLASADINESRALVAAQSQRLLAGDGSVYGLLDAGTELASDVRVDTQVVYVIEVAGHGIDGGPALPLRFVLAAVLLAAVGLLGRAVGALTGSAREGRTVRRPVEQER